MLGWGDYSLTLNLFTGRRDHVSYEKEKEMDRAILQDFGQNEILLMKDMVDIASSNESKKMTKYYNKEYNSMYKDFFRSISNSGQYGEKYTHGFVVESKNMYRYGGLTFNRTVGNNTESWGLNSEWFRHGFQNKFAHDFASYQRQFPMLSNTFTPIRNLSTQRNSKFTFWGK